MNYLFVGDLHCRYDIFKQITAFVIKNDYTIICVGDYVDSWETDKSDLKRTKAQRGQFKLLSLVKSMQDNGHLFIRGNHDISYLDPSMRCNGYQPSVAPALKVKIEALNLPDYLIIETTGGQNILVTHAGLSRKFVNQAWGGSISNIEDRFEKAYNNFSDPLYRQGEFIKDDPDPMNLGRMVFGGPMWCRPREFEPLEYYRQVFGHSNTDWVLNHEGVWIYEGEESNKWYNINVDSFKQGHQDCLLYQDLKDEFSIIKWETIVENS